MEQPEGEAGFLHQGCPLKVVEGVLRRAARTPANATNVALAELVRGLGVSMESVFLTNAILCLKQGGCQAAANPEWFRNCAERFLKPTIEEIKPRVLVTLGQHAYESVRSVYGLALVRFRDAVDRVEPFVLPNGTRFFAVHPPEIGFQPNSHIQNDFSSFYRTLGSRMSPRVLLAKLSRLIGNVAIVCCA